MDNAEKNRFVKRQITAALLAALETKELKDISVSQIAADAGVSRISFYRNFQNKEGVLRAYMAQLMNGRINGPKPDKTYPEPDILGEKFSCLVEYKDFFLLLRKRNLLYLLKDIIMEILGPKPESPNFSAYTSAFLAYGLYGWIEEWFARGMKESAWEMKELLKIGI